MTNETFEPMGLVDITREITKLNRNRKRLDDMTDRLQSALDAKRDLQGQVSADYANQLDTAVKRNESLWKDGYTIGFENGERKGYDEGYKAGRDSEMRASEQRDRELLEEQGIDVEPLFQNVQKIIADHESDKDEMVEKLSGLDYIVDDDTDEDEPDQYPVNYGGTK